MRVLISAYACEPGAGSEPGAGWTWARAAALDHEVWLLTREQNEASIKAALDEEPHLRLNPVYLDLPSWARRWKRGNRGVHLYYLIWQALAWNKASELQRRLRFDVAHHLTFAVDWMPAAVCWLGLPSVWGPVGGATGMSVHLWRWLGVRGAVKEAVREVATRFARRVFGDPTANRCSIIVAQNEDVKDRFVRRGPVAVEPNPALDMTTIEQTRVDHQPSSEVARIAVFSGRLISWKGPRLAIAALAHPAAREWQLRFYGNGPEERACRRLAARLGVSDRVHFLGWQNRDEVLAALGSADAMLFPSMHDSAGWAVAEAVALGVPVVCLDRGGPPVLAAGDGHVRVNDSGDVVEQLALGLARVAASPMPAGSDRWSADRLPALLQGLYEEAVRCHGHS